MATDIEICTAALLALGDRPIASFDQADSKAATICANLYPIARREILRAHPWNCCITRVVLAPEAQAPAFGWGKQFLLPGDVLRVLSVGLEGQPESYELEGRKILMSTDVCRLRYVADTGEGAWDSLLVYVMVKRMEIALAYPIVKSTSLRDSLKEDFYRQGTGVLAQAKAIDGQENPPEDWPHSTLVEVRGGRPIGP